MGLYCPTTRRTRIQRSPLSTYACDSNSWFLSSASRTFFGGLCGLAGFGFQSASLSFLVATLLQPICRGCFRILFSDGLFATFFGDRGEGQRPSGRHGQQERNTDDERGGAGSLRQRQVAWFGRCAGRRSTSAEAIAGDPQPARRLSDSVFDGLSPSPSGKSSPNSTGTCLSRLRRTRSSSSRMRVRRLPPSPRTGSFWVRAHRGRPQAVDVGAIVDAGLLAQRLLGTHVGKRAEDLVYPP